MISSNPLYFLFTASCFSIMLIKGQEMTKVRGDPSTAITGNVEISPTDSYDKTVGRFKIVSETDVEGGSKLVSYIDTWGSSKLVSHTDATGICNAETTRTDEKETQDTTRTFWSETQGTARTGLNEIQGTTRTDWNETQGTTRTDWNETQGTARTDWNETQGTTRSDRKESQNISTTKNIFYETKTANIRSADWRVVHVSTSDLMNCLETGVTISVVADRGTVSMNTSGVRWNPSGTRVCFVLLIVPAGKVVRLESEQFLWMWYYGNIQIFDGNEMSGRLLVSVVNFINSRLENVFSTNNSLLFVFSVRAVDRLLDITFKFQAVEESSKPSLKVEYTSLKQGIIQSPGFESRSHYPPNIEEWVEIRLLLMETIMISVQYLLLDFFGECSRDYISLYREYNLEINLIWSLCDKIPETTVLHKITVLRLKFKTGTYMFREGGFKLFFSLHDEQETPQKVLNGQWNCSVPYFIKFRHHFECNLKRECEHGEDEKECPYTSDACEGNIAHGKHCYAFTIMEDNQSWQDAKRFCEMQGGQLASLNSISKWQTVGQTLRYRHSQKSFYIGLRRSSYAVSAYYLGLLRWSDGTIAYNTFTDIGQTLPEYACTYVQTSAQISEMSIQLTICEGRWMSLDVLCEYDATSSFENSDLVHAVAGIRTSSTWSDKVRYVQCPGGHVTHDFLSCDRQSACYGVKGTSVCGSPVPQVPDFACGNRLETIPYSLVCNFRRDCSDGSDESVCIFNECKISEKKCSNGQCLPLTVFCNYVDDCFDGSDEQECSQYTFDRIQNLTHLLPPPVIVLLDNQGIPMVQAMNTSGDCPETHFMCSSELYCLPVYLRCNGVSDCPEHEDEAECDRYTCPGFYRCRTSRVCLHANHVCDDVFQCPEGDDELLCGLRCPNNCSCLGMAFTCTGLFPATDYPQLRYLDASHTANVSEFISGVKLSNNHLLIYLSLKNCQLTNLHVHEIIFNASLSNLLVLDLSQNHLTYFSNVMHILSATPNLKVLKLSGNPLVLNMVATGQTYPLLNVLDLSDINLIEVNDSQIQALSELLEFNLSNARLSTINPGFLSKLTKLEMLDLRGNPLRSVPLLEIKYMKSLRTLWSDDFKLCCVSIIPQSLRLENCFAPSSDVSSCEDLFRVSLYRVMLWLIAILALGGNGINIIIKVFFENDIQSAHSIFIFTLFLSYFLHGIVLAIIGFADIIFQSNYVWHDNHWKQSAVCRTVGVLFHFVNGLSAFIIFFINLDRFLQLKMFPLQFNFRKWSTILSCAITWSLGVALVPLLPEASNWKFYGQTGICIHIPVQVDRNGDYSYFMITTLFLNFILFTSVALGKVVNFQANRDVYLSTEFLSAEECVPSYYATNIDMLSVGSYVITSCLHCFIITGVISSNDVTIGITLFLNPLNSALSPLLYRWNALRQKQQRAQEQRLVVILEREMKLSGLI